MIKMPRYFGEVRQLSNRARNHNKLKFDDQNVTRLIVWRTKNLNLALQIIQTPPTKDFLDLLYGSYSTKESFSHSNIPYPIFFVYHIIHY